jgi:hypothetical protein
MRAQRAMFAAAAAVALLSAAPAARADGWIASWGASDVFPIGQQINYQTLRQIVRLSAGGKHVPQAFLERDQTLFGGHRRRSHREASFRRAHGDRRRRN